MPYLCWAYDLPLSPPNPLHYTLYRIFCELFTDLVELQVEKKKSMPVVEEVNRPPRISEDLSHNTPWPTVLGIFAAIIACTWALLALAL
jgi:hypothetical protein